MICLPSFAQTQFSKMWLMDGEIQLQFENTSENKGGLLNLKVSERGRVVVDFLFFSEATADMELTRLSGQDLKIWIIRTLNASFDVHIVEYRGGNVFVSEPVDFRTRLHENDMPRAQRLRVRVARALAPMTFSWETAVGACKGIF